MRFGGFIVGLEFCFGCFTIVDDFGHGDDSQAWGKTFHRSVGYGHLTVTIPSAVACAAISSFA